MGLQEKRTGAGNAPLDHTSKYANTDAAFQDEINSRGLDFVARNGTGEAIAAGHGHMQVTVGALQAEAQALLNVVHRSAAMGCNNVVLRQWRSQHVMAGYLGSNETNGSNAKLLLSTY